MGIERVSCVGGRHLANELLAAGLVDDVYLTTSPLRGGTPGTPVDPAAVQGELAVRKRGTGPEEGVVFEQFSTPRRAL